MTPPPTGTVATSTVVPAEVPLGVVAGGEFVVWSPDPEEHAPTPAVTAAAPRTIAERRVTVLSAIGLSLRSGGRADRMRTAVGRPRTDPSRPAGATNGTSVSRRRVARRRVSTGSASPALEDSPQEPPGMR